MKKRVTIKDVAKHIGVSTALVSYVLNDKFTNRINPETAKTIKKVANELNYTPNHIAQSLKNNKTFTIGLIIADISNLFYSNIARFIENEAERNNYSVIFASADENAEKFSGLVDIFLSRQVDGIILAAPPDSERILENLRDQGIPFVLIDRIFPVIDGISSVMIDNYKASNDVANHLLEKKFVRPTLVTLVSKLHHLQERSRGFREAFKSADDYNIVEIKEQDLSRQIEKILLNLLDSPKTIDSVYFSTNKIAMEGLAVLAKHKVQVPEQLGVVCFDEAIAYRIFNTSITYVKQPLKEIGEEAVRLILTKIDGKAEARSKILKTEIIQGNSTLKD